MKKLVLVIAGAFFALLAFSQDTVNFGRNNSYDATGKKLSNQESILKIAPLSFISGYIPFYYEREIKPYLSIQAGAGLTTRNYLKGWLSDINESNNTPDEQLTWNSPAATSENNMLSRYDYMNRKASPGYYLSLQPRIYFASEGLEGGYLGISFDYFHYASKHKKIIGGPMNDAPAFSEDFFKEFENISDILVSFGNQRLYDRISLEYAIATGLRNIHSQHYAYTNHNGDYLDGVSNSRATKFSLNVAIRVGYIF